MPKNNNGVFYGAHRQAFLKHRAANTAAAKAEVEASSSDVFVIVGDPGDDTICDFCNKEITESVLWLHYIGPGEPDGSERAACAECRTSLYLKNECRSFCCPPGMDKEEGESLVWSGF